MPALAVYLLLFLRVLKGLWFISVNPRKSAVKRLVFSFGCGFTALRLEMSKLPIRPPFLDTPWIRQGYGSRHLRSRSGFRLATPASLTPPKRLKLGGKFSSATT
jgi:hypothetical protein